MSALRISSHPVDVASNSETSVSIRTATFWIWLTIHCWFSWMTSKRYIDVPILVNHHTVQPSFRFIPCPIINLCPYCDLQTACWTQISTWGCQFKQLSRWYPNHRELPLLNCIVSSYHIINHQFASISDCLPF
jgi:hypothetical protein